MHAPRSLRLFITVLFVGIGASVFAATPAEEMAAATTALLNSLTPEQKAKAVFEFKENERLNWHFIPRTRKGLPVKDMNSASHALAHALLSSGMSQRGYIKAVSIMSLDQVLKEMEGPNGTMVRDPENYYFSVFGTPGPKGVWGWRVEGHHFSLNYTIVNGEFIADSPNFLGANPAEVKQGSREGLRVLGAEEDLGRALVKSLNDEQRKVCIYTNVAPKDIITSTNRNLHPLEPKGIAYAKLNASQKEGLMTLVKEYVNRVRPEVAANDLKKIEAAGLDNIFFSWAGGLERGEGHYYRAQGPTFLLEYDNTQNNNNHIHAVWRDFNGDFGEDILAKHYAENPH